MGERHMRDGRRHMFAVVEQRHDAGVQGLEGATVMLSCVSGMKSERNIGGWAKR